jgi:hypothetical protein
MENFTLLHLSKSGDFVRIFCNIKRGAQEFVLFINYFKRNKFKEGGLDMNHTCARWKLKNDFSNAGRSLWKLGVDRKIVLLWILNNMREREIDVKLLRYDGSCGHGNEPANSIKGGEYPDRPSFCLVGSD